jgi:hypothetical protein
MLRKVFGAGPASGQVQYVTKKQGAVRYLQTVVRKDKVRTGMKTKTMV